MTTLLIEATDNLSGVRTVTGNVRSPSGAAILPFETQGASGSNVFAARITIPAKAESGLWYVANVYVVDRADNTLVAGFTATTIPAGGALGVSSSESDSTAPEVTGVSVEKGSVRDGEKNLIRVEVQDDRSGVAAVTGAFQSPSRSAFIRFACRLDADAGIWVGEVAVPKNADCGGWTLQQLRVADNAGNTGFLPSGSPLVGHADFQVLSQENCDSIPPILETLDLSPRSLSNETGAEILVTAAVDDEGSGTISVSGWVSGPISTNGQVPKISFFCAQNSKDPRAPWTGKILVPQYAAKGTWKVGRVRVQDKALNVREYTPEDTVISGATFEVE